MMDVASIPDMPPFTYGLIAFQAPDCCCLSAILISLQASAAAAAEQDEKKYAKKIPRHPANQRAVDRAAVMVQLYIAMRRKDTKPPYACSAIEAHLHLTCTST